MDWLLPTPSLILASSVSIVLIGGFINRLGKGIGWQFIRFTVLAISIPIISLLALNNALTGEAATIIAAAMGYAFAKTDEKQRDEKPKQG